MSYTRNITMWGNISKLTQFDILIGLHKQSHATFPISMFIFSRFSGQLRPLQSITKHIVWVLENKNKVPVTCRQVPDAQVQVQVQVLRNGTRVQYWSRSTSTKYYISGSHT